MRMKLEPEERQLVAHIRRQYQRKGFICLNHPHHENNPTTPCRWMHRTYMKEPA